MNKTNRNVREDAGYKRKSQQRTTKLIHSNVPMRPLVKSLSAQLLQALLYDLLELQPAIAKMAHDLPTINTNEDEVPATFDANCSVSVMLSMSSLLLLRRLQDQSSASQGPRASLLLLLQGQTALALRNKLFVNMFLNVTFLQVGVFFFRAFHTLLNGEIQALQ